MQTPDGVRCGACSRKIDLTPSVVGVEYLPARRGDNVTILANTLLCACGYFGPKELHPPCSDPSTPVHTYTQTVIFEEKGDPVRAE